MAEGYYGTWRQRARPTETIVRRGDAVRMPWSFWLRGDDGCETRVDASWANDRVARGHARLVIADEPERSHRS
jgi:hypothetical protein